MSDIADTESAPSHSCVGCVRCLALELMALLPVGPRPSDDSASRRRRTSRGNCACDQRLPGRQSAISRIGTRDSSGSRPIASDVVVRARLSSSGDGGQLPRCVCRDRQRAYLPTTVMPAPTGAIKVATSNRPHSRNNSGTSGRVHATLSRKNVAYGEFWIAAIQAITAGDGARLSRSSSGTDAIVHTGCSTISISSARLG